MGCVVVTDRTIEVIFRKHCPQGALVMRTYVNVATLLAGRVRSLLSVQPGSGNDRHLPTSTAARDCSASMEGAPAIPHACGTTQPNRSPFTAVRNAGFVCTSPPDLSVSPTLMPSASSSPSRAAGPGRRDRISPIKPELAGRSDHGGGRGCHRPRQRQRAACEGRRPLGRRQPFE